MQQKEFSGKLSQSSVGFWRDKLTEQLEIIKHKKKEKSLERLYALDIALTYFFLHMYAESAVDYFMENLCRYSMRDDIAKEYAEKHLYLSGKIQFIFDHFCSDLPYGEYLELKNLVVGLASIRSQVVHLHEMSWGISMSLDGGLHKEHPNKFAGLLTEEKLKQQIRQVNIFLDALKDAVRRGLKGEMYGGMIRIGDKHILADKKGAVGLVNHISKLLPPPIDVESL